MSVEHPPLERLSEFIDGELPLEAAAAIERHLATCAPCRRNLVAMRDLVGRAAALPPSIEPPPGAWVALRGKLSHRSTVARAPAARWMREWGLRAAAAVVLVAGSSAVTIFALRGREDAGRVASLREQQAMRPPAVPASVAAVDRNYAAVVDELTSTLEAQRARLAPSTVATLERTLRVIDEAIAEARAALAADPANDALLDVLSANYEQKVELLRRASELPART